MATTPEEITLDDVMRLPKFFKRYPDVASPSTIRWMIYNRETNGLAEAEAVNKVNGCWVVIVPNFLRYLTGKAA